MDSKPQIPTLQDVADAAGVSTASVSRCINSPDQVAQKTRDKILATIEKLGYSPNFGASAMAARRTNTVGAIIPTMENAIFARGLQAFQEELHLHGFTMLVASTSYRPEIEKEQIRSLVARGADALLLIGHERDPKVFEFLDARGVPAIVTWTVDPNEARPSVGFDNAAAIYNMTKEAIRLGHTRIAMISAETATNDRAAARVRGIQDAMRDAGLNPSDLTTIETPYSIENGVKAFEQILATQPRPTVVFCGSDVYAVGALRRAHELGVKVPDDISIVGFDDLELAQVAHPPLTTIRVPHKEMGRAAAASLVNLLKNKVPLSTIELPVELVFRDTLAPAPQTKS